MRIPKKPPKRNLQSEYPAIAAEWHPTKNGEVTPDLIYPNTKTKYWWLMHYDDPKTGKHFEFEWPASPNDRVHGARCPVLCGKMVCVGFNDLATTEPELAKQWHPTKNGDRKPTEVTRGCRDKVHWLMPYDDPVTGKHFELEWEAAIQDRSKGAGCPYLTGAAVCPGFNDLATRAPEIAAQWHPTKNGDRRATDVSCGCRDDIWWLQPYDDPETGKHFDFEWQASPNDRTSGNGCPFLSGRAVYAGYNDLETRYPEIAAQWHPTKNGDKKPTEIAYSSNKEYWWLQPYDDPKTGKHFDFEWPAKVNNRTLLGEGCPFLGNDKVYPGYNDLASCYPEIAAQWHPTKNGKLTPKDVVYGTPQNVWWCLPYTDPRTGKYFEFEWQAPVNIRTGVGTNDGHQTACPYLSNDKVWSGYNDLASCYPEIAAQWHPIKNRKKTPDKVYHGTIKKAWWKCDKCGHSWYSSISGRTLGGVNCSKCK